MPPLLNVSTPLFLSNTVPPFLYQCIGEKIQIVQVLGNFETTPQNSNVQLQNNQIVVQSKEIIDNNILNTEKTLLATSNSETKNDIPKSDNKDKSKYDDVDIKPIQTDKINSCRTIENKIDVSIDSTINIDHIDSTKTNKPNYSSTVTNEHTDCISIDNVSLSEHYSAESDDEASFGTPEDSPKSKRKRSPRVGKYGKAKAPLPPSRILEETIAKEHSLRTNEQELSTDTPSLTNSCLNQNINSNRSLCVINPIAENKRRHKSKSPVRRKSSTIGKLLQLPGKIAFWNKNDERPKSDLSNSSDDHSRRSSTVEKNMDEFQSCSDLNVLIEGNTINEEKMPSSTERTDDHISFKDAIELDGELMSQNIIDRSDELQKLIEAKLESHPEYKIISLHAEEISSSSKSTDV